MPEQRTLEDRFYAFILNTVEAVTAFQSGEKIIYSTKAGSESFFELGLVANSSELSEARSRAFECVRRT